MKRNRSIDESRDSQVDLFEPSVSDQRQTRLPVYETELLTAMEQYYGPLDEAAAALAALSLFVREGHVFLPLDRSPQQWQELLEWEGEFFPDAVERTRSRIESHPMAGPPEGDTPLVLSGNRLYFRTHYRLEGELADSLRRLANREGWSRLSVESERRLAELFPDLPGEINWQRLAAAVALISPLLILSGGPGTGKTTTVSRILSLLARQAEVPLSVAIAAPTGKAAARLSQVLEEQLASVSESDRKNLRFRSATLHRLLTGLDRAEMFPPVWPEPLLYDLIVVDEASMADLTILTRLVRHLGSHTRLIILGDHHQLSSVEAGAVLSSLCRKEANRFSPQMASALTPLSNGHPLSEGELSPLEDVTVYLEHGYRFDNDSGIGRLADALKNGDSAGVANLVQQLWPDLRVEPPVRDGRSLESVTNHFFDRFREAGGCNGAELCDHWNREIWLTLTRRGYFGSEQLNRYLESRLEHEGLIRREGAWYHGRPVLITKNDYLLEIYNGDFGVVVERASGRFVLAMRRPDGSAREIPVERLPACEPSFVLTVHKSQGSEYDQVHLLMPEDPIPLMTRELLYTAITRARRHCVIHGDAKLLSLAAERPTERFSGLSDRLFRDG